MSGEKGDKKDKKEGVVSPSGVFAIIKETYLHPSEESVILTGSGKVVERYDPKKKDKQS